MMHCWVHTYYTEAEKIHSRQFHLETLTTFQYLWTSLQSRPSFCFIHFQFLSQSERLRATQVGFRAIQMWYKLKLKLILTDSFYLMEVIFVE